MPSGCSERVGRRSRSCTEPARRISRRAGSALEQPSRALDALARAAAQLVEVVLRRSGGLRGLGHHAEVPAGGQPALVGAQHVDPGQRAAVERGARAAGSSRAPADSSPTRPGPSRRGPGRRRASRRPSSSGSSTMVASAPSQPTSSPPKVSRQPSQPAGAARRGSAGSAAASARGRGWCRKRRREPPVQDRGVTISAGRHPEARDGHRPTVRRATASSSSAAGPAGYEAALVAVELGAQVTLVERDGMGGACVLTDCVPSKALIATAELLSSVVRLRRARRRLRVGADVEAGRLNGRVRELAGAQSDDIRKRVSRRGRRVIRGPGAAGRAAHASRSRSRRAARPALLDADVVLLAVGATPREIPGSEPDGERILTWRQLYELPELPEHLVVVGSGVTGAEFAVRLPRAGLRGHAGLLPGPGAARGGRRRRRGARGRLPPPRHHGAEQVPGRASVAARPADGVEVTLTSGDVVAGSHVADRRRVGPADRRTSGSRRPASGWPRAATSRSTGSRAPRVARRLRRRRLHRGPAAGLRRRDAGPHRDVARARRGGAAAAAARRSRRTSSPTPRSRRSGSPRQQVESGDVTAEVVHAAAGHQRPGEDGGPARRLREVLLPARAPARCSAGWSWRRGRAS